MNAERFNGRAADYAAGRPSYPAECIRELFADLGEPATLTVVDLGAGTGISSRLLAATGANVIAIEPNADMRAGNCAAPGLSWRAGTAERSGLPPHSADLITAFQAFHWFDAPAALAEMLRIGRPGGRAALVYNERDENDRFTTAYGDLVRRYATDATEARRGTGRTTFERFAGWQRVREAAFPNVAVLNRAGLQARARSTSYLPKDGAAGADLRTSLDALFAAYASGDTVTMHMRTIVLAATIGYGRNSSDERA